MVGSQRECKLEAGCKLISWKNWRGWHGPCATCERVRSSIASRGGSSPCRRQMGRRLPCALRRRSGATVLAGCQACCRRSDLDSSARKANSRTPPAGTGPTAAKLWLYNLQYFDDLRAEGAAGRLPWHRDLIARWIVENPPVAGNGWEPYPASLRIVNWIAWALAGNDLDPAAAAESRGAGTCSRRDARISPARQSSLGQRQGAGVCRLFLFRQRGGRLAADRAGSVGDGIRRAKFSTTVRILN